MFNADLIGTELISADIIDADFLTCFYVYYAADLVIEKLYIWKNCFWSETHATSNGTGTIV
jgi:hypothetical protein